MVTVIERDLKKGNVWRLQNGKVVAMYTENSLGMYINVCFFAMKILSIQVTVCSSAWCRTGDLVSDVCSRQLVPDAGQVIANASLK